MSTAKGREVYGNVANGKVIDPKDNDAVSLDLADDNECLVDSVEDPW